MRFRRRVTKPAHHIKLSLIDKHTPYQLNPGDFLTVDGHFTIWARRDGVLEIGPELSEDQQHARTAREICAKYGVTMGGQTR